MKNYYKFRILFSLLLVSAMFSCNDTDDNFGGGEDPTTGWIEFATASQTLSPSTTETEVEIDVNVPVFTNGLNIGYEFIPVSGDFNTIVTSATSGTVNIDASNTDREVSIPITFSSVAGLPDTIVFDVVLTSVDQEGVSVGVGVESILSHRIATPCPIDIATTYTATEVLYNGQATPPQGHTAVFTVVDAANFIYSIDTTWGPDFISTLCNGCVPGGEYVGPLTFSINPQTLEITVIDGGEPSGLGQTFDIAYDISGTGVIDTCNNTITLDLEQTLLTSAGIPGTVDVTFTAN